MCHPIFLEHAFESDGEDNSKHTLQPRTSLWRVGVIRERPLETNSLVIAALLFQDILTAR
jgi:hypothetical protein